MAHHVEHLAYPSLLVAIAERGGATTGPVYERYFDDLRSHAGDGPTTELLHPC